VLATDQVRDGGVIVALAKNGLTAVCIGPLRGRTATTIRKAEAALAIATIAAVLVTIVIVPSQLCVGAVAGQGWGQYGVRTASTVVHRNVPEHDITGTGLQICLGQIAGSNRAFRGIDGFDVRPDPRLDRSDLL